MVSNIFEFVKTEKTAYETRGVTVAEGFEWHMPEHIKHCILVKDGRLLTGNTDDKPVKNIVLPILNVNYRSEGFDVKDIEPYVDSSENYYKSFIVRKYHEKWARENQIDTFIDDVVESYVDFGGVLVKNSKGPELIPLQKLAFCDQTDILSGPFAIKHQYSIDQLKEKEDKWNKEAINDLISDARYEKTNDQSNSRTSKTPGKYIEVYEVHGMFPTAWLTSDTELYNEYDEDNYTRQIQIIAFSSSDEKNRTGYTLFKGKEKDGLFKVLKRDKRYGTALGRSAIEELFESQVWTNYSMIQIKNMLDKASIMLGITDDAGFDTQNRFTDLEQGEWIKKNPGTTVEPFIFPMNNVQQFENAIIGWENHARTTGSANDSAMGVSPSAGTPFKLQELVVQEGRGIHDYRRGKIATFIEEIYRDWELQRMVEEMNGGQKFMSDLTLDELQEISEQVMVNYGNRKAKELILTGQGVEPEQLEGLKNVMKDNFMKTGSKKFMEIFKDELKDVPLDVYINVAGKQKNVSLLVDKLTNVFRDVIANPQILQDPNASKLFNTILETSGISPINFMRVSAPKTEEPAEIPLQDKPQLV